MDGETTLLSYDDIARIFGIERESARQLVLRKRWKRIKGNDNKTRVEVPNDTLPTGPSFRPAESTSDDTAEDASLARVLARHIERLERELDTARQTAKQLEASRDEARSATRDAERDRDVAREAERTIIREVAALAAALEVEKAKVGFEHSRANELKAERDRWADQASRSWWKRFLG